MEQRKLVAEAFGAAVLVLVGVGWRRAAMSTRR